jgi:hypothetical protein
MAHRWQDCTPVLLPFDGPGGVSVTGEQLDMAWSLVPDRDRRLFHEFCCENRHDDVTEAAMDRIVALVELLHP